MYKWKKRAGGSRSTGAKRFLPFTCNFLLSQTRCPVVKRPFTFAMSYWNTLLLALSDNTSGMLLLSEEIFLFFISDLPDSCLEDVRLFWAFYLDTYFLDKTGYSIFLDFNILVLKRVALYTGIDGKLDHSILKEPRGGGTPHMSFI